MSKWIKWKGGECPVAMGTLVDVRYRDGYATYGVRALESDCGHYRDAGSAFWSNDGINNDIVAYRIHMPIIHTTTENPITHKALAKLHAKLDRIERKLDLVIGRSLVVLEAKPAEPQAGNAEKDVKPQWMSHFNADRAKEVFAWRYTGYALREAFIWSDTIEGFNFWNEEDDNLREGKPISERARTALTRMIAEYEAAN